MDSRFLFMIPDPRCGLFLRLCFLVRPVLLFPSFAPFSSSIELRLAEALIT